MFLKYVFLALLSLQLRQLCLAQFDKCSDDTVTNSDIDTLLVYTITILGAEIYEASRLASEVINADPTILPNYTINVTALRTYENKDNALTSALGIIDEGYECLVRSSTTAISPFLGGAPWSSLSINSAGALSAYEMAQISSSATSVLLSDRNNFPHFYRTVPEDSMQSQGIILLCKHFNWQEISILHDNDGYGTYLTVQTLELALAAGIQARAVGYQREDDKSIEAATQSLKSLGSYIIVVIMHGTDINTVFSNLNASGLWQYPYFFIGVDAWLSSADIIERNATHFAGGSIGTFPWAAGDLEQEDYEGDLGVIYNQSLVIGEMIGELWTAELAKNGTWIAAVPNPSGYYVYGWDSMYTIALALHYFDQAYDLKKLFDNTYNSTFFADKLHDIMTSQVQFLGATGNVTFGPNGDRTQALYSFSNCKEDGSVSPFGYLYQDGDEYKSVILEDEIYWPAYFTEHDITPKSDPVITFEISRIHTTGFTVICCLVVLSMISVLACAGMTVFYRDTVIIQNAGWKLNLVMCSGAMLLYICVLLYGVDEGHGDIEFGVLCNFRIWFGTIAFTLLFMPLFLKTYRLSKIYTDFVKASVISDRNLYIAICCCLAIDVLLLIIMTGIEPHDRYYIDAELKKIDTLQYVQYEYGVCKLSTHALNMAFYLVIGLWKLFQLVFGIYVAMLLGRIGVKELLNFAETGLQTVNILVIVIIIGITVPTSLLVDDKLITQEFVGVSVAAFIGCNLTLAINILPRLSGVWCGKDKEMYHQSTQEKMYKYMKAKVVAFNVPTGSTSSRSAGSAIVPT